MDSRDKNFFLRLLRHSQEAMHPLMNTENKHSGREGEGRVKLSQHRDNNSFLLKGDTPCCSLQNVSTRLQPEYRYRVCTSIWYGQL